MPAKEKDVELKKYYRPREAAKFLGVSTPTIWRWTSQGKLPRGIKLGRNVTVWELATLENFVESRAARQEVSYASLK